jgi:hypothetical protein
LLLIAALCAAPVYAGDLQPGQVASSGDRGCQFDALPVPGGFAIYDHAGGLLHQQPPSPGASTLRDLIALGGRIVGVPDGGTNESSIETIDADGNRAPFTAHLPGLTSASIAGLAPAGRDAIYAVVAGDRGAEVWRIDRAGGVTLKRQLPDARNIPGSLIGLDTDASGCTLYYPTNDSNGHIARFNVCSGVALADFGGGSYAAAGLRLLPDGGILMHDLSKLRRYDRNGALVRELPLNVLFPPPSPEYFASIEGIALDPDPHFVWLLVSDGNPCGGSIPLLVNLDSAQAVNSPFPNFALNRYLSLAVAGGWSAAISSAPPPRRRAAVPPEN